MMDVRRAQHIEIGSERPLPALSIFDRIGVHSPRMRFFAGGMTYTAATIGLVWLAAYVTLSIAVSSGGRLQAGMSQVAMAMAISSLVVFALIGLLMFPLSAKI